MILLLAQNVKVKIEQQIYLIVNVNSAFSIIIQIKIVNNVLVLVNHVKLLIVNVYPVLMDTIFLEIPVLNV